MLVVAALGGNALLRRGEPMTADTQRRNARLAAGALAEIVRAGHRLVITHGNGPQVGLLALQGAAYRPEEAYPLDVLGAETEGMIGYLIEQEIENALGPGTMVAALLTQVEADPNDPGFARPTKFVGPVYDEEQARRIAAERGWQVARDGDRWRRVVASPEPVRIPDLKILRFLVDQGVIVICAGGGGIPVVRRPDGSMIGIEAVIDKDSTSALLATQLGADVLLMLTDVDAVYQGWGTAQRAPIHRLTAAEARALDLPDGSMGPKVEAAARFAEDAGRWAGIGTLADAPAILLGDRGTRIG